MTYTAQTRVLVVDAEHPDAGAIQQAADVLRRGGLVAFPTETVYGLGANALDADAVARIYSAKGRPANNPLIVHIAALEQLEQVAVDIPARAHQLAAIFWPGPLTLVLKRHGRVPQNVSLGRDTVAVRFPAHPVACALIAAAGVPVAAPSANRFTRPSATSAAHVLADLEGHVDLVLDGGSTPIGVESTVLDLTGETPVVLRHGGVTLEALRACLPDLQPITAVIATDDRAAHPASPGMMVKHYSPEAEVVLLDGPPDAVIEHMRRIAREYLAAGQRVGLLLPDSEQPLFAGFEVQFAPLGADREAMAHNLYHALRTLDKNDVDVILAHLVEPEGLGATINDRLTRAAEGRIILVKPAQGEPHHAASSG